MARTRDSDEPRDKSIGLMGYSESVTGTGSLLICSDVKEHTTIIETFKEGECILALLPTHTAAYMKHPILCEEQSWGSGSLHNDSIVCEGTSTRFKSREITKDSNNSTIN
jgi:hypothetical protein